MKRFFFLFAACLFIDCVRAENKAVLEEGVGLTVYNQNFAIIKERRKMDFAEGLNTVKFTDVATFIDPTSVSFECLSAPGAVSILEQNYQYDLANTDSLLKRYIDKNVVLRIKGSGSDSGRIVEGILASPTQDRNIIIQKTEGIEIISLGSIDGITLKEIPTDLLTKPTLLWLANAEKAGTQLCQVTYTTEQMSWKADYTAILNADETALDLSGWVTIDNKSGAGYKDAIIKLIAGDVRRIQPPRPMMYDQEMAFGMRAHKAAEAFEEKAFMEYHLYTLGRKTTVNNNEVKQIEFIEPALGIAAKKVYIYDRQQKDDKLQLKVEFENTQENHLGIALPKGKVRVFKKDPADGMLEFVGEDLIDHTPRKEKLSLYIGDVFDVVPKYTMLDQKREGDVITQVQKIELRNRKDTAVTVFVDEKCYAYNWRISKETHKFEKRDAKTARFTIDIPADSTAVLQYTLTMWPD